jgi:solute carrier family 45 protein 1/2/4
VSVGLPFFISDSGIQPRHEHEHEYTGLNNGHGLGMGDIPGSAVWKRERAERERGDEGFMSRMKGRGEWSIQSVKDGSAWVLPVQGLTLVRVWYGTCFLFAGTMGATW